MFDKARLRALRLIKGLGQDGLKGLSQNQVSNCEKNGTDSIRLLSLMATALDCSEAFLRGKEFESLNLDDTTEVRRVASLMALDVFCKCLAATDARNLVCRRVVGHAAAPITCEGWIALAEQIELATAPTDGGNFRTIEGGKAS